MANSVSFTCDRELNVKFKYMKLKLGLSGQQTFEHLVTIWFDNLSQQDITTFNRYAQVVEQYRACEAGLSPLGEKILGVFDETHNPPS